MKAIEKLCEAILDEVEGAEEYAEKYIEMRSFPETNFAAKYREMAHDELKHAGYMHDIAHHRIEAIRTVKELSLEDEELWHHTQKRYHEWTARIKLMLQG
jgi:hypothetical protein